MKATGDTEITEKDELTHAVIGAALEVHRILGPGLLESIYEKALCHELTLRVSVSNVRKQSTSFTRATFGSSH